MNWSWDSLMTGAIAIASWELVKLIERKITIRHALRELNK